MAEYDVQMPDDVSDIHDFYSRSPDYEDERLLRHQLEFELTLRYFDEFLPAKSNILELGAATGRYSLELAKRGHRGTAVDLSAALIERCRQRLNEAGYTADWQTIVGDARTVEIQEQFDAVLVMGPLYHLVETADRSTVLDNARNWLIDDGLIFSAWISRYGILGDLIKNLPNWIEREDEVASVLAEGRDPPGPRSGFRGYFVRVDEIESAHAEAGFKKVALAAVEPAISADDDSYNSLIHSVRSRWLELLFAISQESSILGASRHLLYVGRKAGSPSQGVCPVKK